PTPLLPSTATAACNRFHVPPTKRLDLLRYLFPSSKECLMSQRGRKRKDRRKKKANHGKRPNA
ncbi:hypothetical protein NQ024_09895, partial [Corynebacterium sp. 35RC1]|nr:hypothetical protein [Corynebacterium sp. 35RC1]